MLKGSGKTMSVLLNETLLNWEIPKNAILGMCWDTTASNTGVIKGSATLFENSIGHSILWLGCRHHIGDLHITHADAAARPEQNETTGNEKYVSFNR